MELQKLKYFQTVARLEHMTRAAEILHIAQPSLTQAIHSLEDELGVPLFRKNGRRIFLTEYGECLLKKLDVLLPEFESIPEELSVLKNNVSKTVKLNILAASSFVIGVIVNYRQINPDVIFEFEQSELKQNCDILITTNGNHSGCRSDCIKKCIKEENIYLAVPKSSGFASYESIELSEVKDERFVMLSSSRLFGAICNKYCAMAGFTPKILFESDSPIAVQNIISTGTGVAFWPEYSWGQIKNKNVSLIPISFPDCHRDIIIELYDRAPCSVYAKDFYEYLLRRIENNRATAFSPNR